MKKLLLLLALSFFSIQGFAAGCPDGSEPVKSISADGTYFVFDCKNIASLNSDNSNKKYFEVLNLKTIDDKYFTEIFDYATSKIKYIPADQNTLAIFIPVGRWLTTCNTESTFYGCGNNINEVILTNAQIDNAFRVIDDFQKQENCWDENSIRQVERLKFEISKGVSKGYAADLCRNSKLILLSFGSSDDALLTEHIFHEAYHTFQNNTDMCNSWDMPNYRFLTEGAAEYFRYYYMLERKNSLDEFENFILYEVSKNPYPDGFTALGEGESKYTQYMPGLASIALMIDQGWATQSSILDASFFSDCRGVRQFLIGSDKLKYLNDNWDKIELHNGNLRFNPLLSDDEVRVQNSFIKDLAIASSKKIPENAYSTGSFSSGVWDCKVGYEKHNNGCRKKSDPENSYSLSEDIPLNSHKSGGGWECNTGYTQYGSKCVAKSTNQETKVIPESTQNESSDYLEEIKTSEKSKSVSQSEEYPTVSIEESYEDILLNSARIDAKQKISGFYFSKAIYRKMVKKYGFLVKSAPETEITGWYQRLPEENDWHTGIIFFEKGQLKWKNEAGVEWNLQPDINNNKLITGEDNPYQTEYEPDFTLIKTSEKSKSTSKEVSTLETNESVDYVERLKQIKALLDDGIINQDDFEKMKQKIIDTMN